jgi:hypothetical protein
MRINAARLSSQLARATSGSLWPQTDAERQSLVPNGAPVFACWEVRLRIRSHGPLQQRRPVRDKTLRPPIP